MVSGMASSDIAILATYRSRNVRNSEEIFNKGKAILQSNRINSMGSEC